MDAMLNKAMETPNEPVAMAIVDSAGNLLSYLTMDNLRIFSRRHALRKAHTSALMGWTPARTPAGCTARAATSPTRATP